MNDLMGRWPLVGRNQLLESLEQTTLRDSHTGVCLRGEAGVGKTRLARELASRFDDRSSTRTEWVTGNSGVREFPFAALSPWLDESTELLDESILPALIRRRLLNEEKRLCVLVLDDVALIDEASIGLLAGLAGDQHASLILTCREGEVLPRDLQRLINEGRMVEMSLSPLSYGSVASLLEEVLEGSLEEYTLRRLFDLSGGNPLLLRELVIAGVEHGALSKQGPLWRITAPLVDCRTPELIERRLSKLSESVRATLTAVALADSLPFVLVEEEFGPEAVSCLEREGLIEVSQRGLGQEAQVSHPLYKEAIRAKTTTAERRAIYGRLLSAIRSAGARRGEDVVRIARWQLAVGEIDNSDVLLSAARLALASNDHSLALDLVEAALSNSASFEGQLLRGRALSGLGDWREAEEGFSRIQPGDEAETTRLAIARAENLALQGGADSALRVLDDVIVGVASERLRSELKSTLVFIASYLGDLERAASESDRLLARPDLDASARIRTLVISTYAQILMGRFNQTVEDQIEIGLKEAAKRPEEFPLASQLLWINRAVGLGCSGRLKAAEEVAQSRYDEAIEAYDGGPRGMWANNLGYALLARGRPRRALHFFLEALAVFEKQDPVGSMFQAFCFGAIAAGALGDRKTVERLMRGHAEHLNERGRAFGNVVEARAATWQYYADGDLKGAADAAVDAGRLGVSGHQYVHAMYAFHDAVRFGYGHLVADDLSWLAKQVNGVLVDALAFHAQASTAEDPHALREVADRFDRMGADLLAAESLAQASYLFRSLGLNDSANRAAFRSRSRIQKCEGATTPWLWLDRPRALTQRQLEIARLAATGMSDREISDRLHISVRTVSNHLAAAYVKLGIHDRSELGELLQPVLQA